MVICRIIIPHEVRDFSLIDADNFGVGFCALLDDDARFGDMKMFGKKLN